ncbi:hypothetical protein ACGFI9_27895 [Micromonospora sp. NPDC048930]|uniref:hypothetical protein n=1 Tax=Micromonospora sp. NPDC048930 TaxID=3364261 RepID=UPI0037207C83
MRLLRVYVWLAGGLVVGGLGYYFFRLGLDKADKAASVAGLFIGIVGLGISVYNAIAASRSAKDATRKQSVVSSRISGDVFQASNVSGSIKLNSGPSRRGISEGNIPPYGSNNGHLKMDGQTVRDSDVRGPVRQLNEVGGDVEVDG